MASVCVCVCECVSVCEWDAKVAGLIQSQKNQGEIKQKTKKKKAST